MTVCEISRSLQPARQVNAVVRRHRRTTCATLADAANHFIALGERAAAKELDSLVLDWDTDFHGKFSRNERLGWVCRILFEPKGKEPLRAPAYGGLGLPYKTMPLSNWPLYPVARSGSTYFVLSEGYSLKGSPENPEEYLAYCRTTGRFRTERVQSPTRSQALKVLETLRQSEAWKAIKWKDSGQGFSYTMREDWAWGFIKAQAEKMPER
jgi:hypothetical protein